MLEKKMNGGRGRRIKSRRGGGRGGRGKEERRGEERRGVERRGERRGEEAMRGKGSSDLFPQVQIESEEFLTPGHNNCGYR